VPSCVTRSILQVVLVLCATLSAASGNVVRVEVLSRDDVLGGSAFGSSGAYERIVGRVLFAAPVANPHNRRIVDLDKAENLKDGAVEFSADVVILRPKDPSRANGTLLLEVPNRGRPRIVGLVEGGDWNVAASAGDGWLLRNRYSFAAIGWQWDAAGEGRLRLYAPIAKDHGQVITGLLRGDVMLSWGRPPWRQPKVLGANPSQFVPGVRCATKVSCITLT